MKVYGAVSAPQRHWWVRRISFGSWRGTSWYEPAGMRMVILLVARSGVTTSLYIGKPSLPY